MQLLDGKFHGFWSRLKLLRQKGLWPYTPDPAPAGRYHFGRPLPGSPWLIAGNSRHELKQMERILEPTGGRVLALETGGLTLCRALETGRLNGRSLAVAIEEALAGHEMTAPSGIRLPNSVWEMLQQERAVRGLRPHPPGPLATSIGTWPPVRERLHLALAYGVLLLLCMAVPLWLVGWQAVIMGIALVSAAGLGAVLLWPWLRRFHPVDAAHLYALAFAGVTALPPLLGGAGSLRLLAWAGSAYVVSLWLGWLHARFLGAPGCVGRRYVSSRASRIC